MVGLINELDNRHVIALEHIPVVKRTKSYFKKLLEILKIEDLSKRELTVNEIEAIASYGDISMFSSIGSMFKA